MTNPSPDTADQQPTRSPRMTTQRMRELFAQLDATTEPCDGHVPSRELAESKRPEVFREFLWRMHNHPSPEVRYWCCYWLIWERTPSGEFVEVLERQDEYPEIRAQAAEGLANALELTKRHFAWHRRAEAALIRALDAPAVQVRWWSCFALGSARSKRAVPKLRVLAANDHTMLPGWWPVAEEAEDALLRIARQESPDRVPSGHNVWSWGHGGRQMRNAPCRPPAAPARTKPGGDCGALQGPSRDVLGNTEWRVGAQ